MVLGLVMLAACGGDDPTRYQSIAGRYTLRSVSGSAVPYFDPAAGNEYVDGFVDLNAMVTGASKFTMSPMLDPIPCALLRRRQPARSHSMGLRSRSPIRSQETTRRERLAVRLSQLRNTRECLFIRSKATAGCSVKYAGRLCASRKCSWGLQSERYSRPFHRTRLPRAIAPSEM